MGSTRNTRRPQKWNLAAGSLTTKQQPPPIGGIKENDKMKNTELRKIMDNLTPATLAAIAAEMLQSDDASKAGGDFFRAAFAALETNVGLVEADKLISEHK